MTTTLRSDQALSNGLVFQHKAKREKSAEIQKQVEAFLAAGGTIDAPPQDNDAAKAELKKRYGKA